MKKTGIFVLIFLVILSILISKPLDNLDEIWNYNFARNISNNLVPYRDFNMVITPLSAILCGIILKFTANELIVMRLIAALLSTIIIIMIYKIFILIGLKKNISILNTLFIGLLLCKYFCIDYNWASLLITLLLIYNEIKIYKKKNIILNADFMIGLLAGTAFLLKQTSGFIICTVALGNKLLYVRSKKDFNIYIKSFLYRLSGVLLPITVLIVYLLYNQAIYDFINYTIMGISEFSNNIPYSNLLNFNITGLLAILIPISIIYFIYKIIKKKSIELYYFLLYGLGIFVVAFPISDNIHFYIASTPFLVAIFCEITKKIKLDNALSNIIYGIIIMLTIVLINFSAINIYNYISNYSNYSNLNHYSYIIIDKNLENEIEQVNEYINTSQKQVKILDASAALFMIPINKYNKNYDLLLKGNLGGNGEEKIIEEIKNTKNIQYLVLKNEKMLNWQTPLNIISFVKDTKTKVGSIGRFDIYE